MSAFADLLELDVARIESLLASAGELERQPVRDDLRGRILGLLFLNPSLRTLASFQSGMAQLGGSSFVIQPGQGSWGLELDDGVVMDGHNAEHIREAVPVLEQYCDALGVRCFASGSDLATDLSEPVFSAMRDLARKPLINLESAVNHPCQALADWKTLDDLEVPRHGGKLVLSWAWHPRALPLAVPAAVVQMAALRGMDVTVLRPEGFGLPDAILESAREAARSSGGSVSETASREQAMEGAHVVYAKSWGAPQAYGNEPAEQVLREPLRSWCIDEPWFETARRDASLLHCLPVRRNVVVSDAVLDGPRSQVVRQAGNRLHVQKAVLLDLLS